MAILAGHPELNRTNVVIGLNVRGEEWRKADERGEKGSSSPSVGFSSSPPLCQRGKESRDLRCIPIWPIAAQNINVIILPERAPNCGWAARAADMPREPRPPNSGLPAPAE